MPRVRAAFQPLPDFISFTTIAQLPRFLAHGLFLIPAVIWGGIWSEQGLAPAAADGYGTYFWWVLVPGALVLGALVGAARVIDRTRCEQRLVPFMGWLVTLTSLLHVARCGGTLQANVISLATLGMAIALQLSAMEEAYEARVGHLAFVRMRDDSR